MDTPKLPPLFQHQIEGIEYLRGLGDKALFDEPGLGKTRQLIESINHDVDDGLLKGALVICPNILKSTWKREIEKYSSLKPVVFGNDASGRKQAYRHLLASFYIINYEAVTTELSNLKRLLQFRPLAMILDESQRIKNPEAKITQTLLELRGLAKKRIIVTGTPVANLPKDLWSQFFFLDGGELLGDSYNLFKAQYETRSHSSNLIELQEIISSASLRRRKDSVLDLPEKKFIDHEVMLEGLQLDMYNTLRDELVLLVKSMSGDDLLHNAENILTRMLRLNQLASNPSLVDAGYNETPAKFQALDEILDKMMMDPTQKVIIWSSFVPNIFSLVNRYKGFGAVPICGGVSDEDREIYLNQFLNDPNTRILIANPAAAREGLTLTVANVAIYLDRSFNMIDYLQSQDRIHRISQIKECIIIHLIAEGTIDEYIAFALKTKHETAGFIQGDLAFMSDNGEELKSKLLKALL